MKITYRTTSINMSDDVAELVRARGGSSGSFSTIIGNLIRMHEIVMRRSLPSLTEGERDCIRDALSGANLILPDHLDLHVRALALSVSDYGKSSDGGARWGVNTEELAKRLAEMPFAALAAVYDDAVRFWNGPKEEEEKAEPTTVAVRAPSFHDYKYDGVKPFEK